MFVGPSESFLIEEKTFDKYCVFGNEMYLTDDQQEFLEDFCDPSDCENEGIKFYVHRMTYSNVIEGKCKMVS